MDGARVCVIDALAECALDSAVEAVITVWRGLPVASSSTNTRDESDVEKIPTVTEFAAKDDSINIDSATVVVFG